MRNKFKQLNEFPMSVYYIIPYLNSTNANENKTQKSEKKYLNFLFPTFKGYDKTKIIAFILNEKERKHVEENEMVFVNTN